MIQVRFSIPVKRRVMVKSMIDLSYFCRMKIISYNVNGIRAAIKKGFLDWLQTHPADVICIQESKAQQTDVDAQLFNELGYHDHWFCAQKKGYSGVTVFTKIKPDFVKCG